MMSWIWALGWSVCPLVGWGAYAMDGIMGTCSYDYVSQTTNNKTHILAATVANYVLPVITMINSKFLPKSASPRYILTSIDSLWSWYKCITMIRSRS